MTRPADELDAWRALSTELDLAAHPVILAGDINSGLDGKPPRSEEALRRALRFRALRLPTAVEEVLTVGFRDTVHAGMATDFQEMMTRAAPHADGYESMRQYITFDQKMINQVLPWRERFAGRFATVRSPWLDRDVLDFMTRVPRYLRADRKLFKDTVTRMFPDVFEKERVQSLNRPDLRAELIRHAEELRRLLDLEATAAGRLQQRGARLRRRGRNRLSRLFGPAATPEAKPLPPSEVFRRWAILRIALETA
jgi:asparagine synthase (glutamine-hydrolysing)